MWARKPTIPQRQRPRHPSQIRRSEADLRGPIRSRILDFVSNQQLGRLLINRNQPSHAAHQLGVGEPATSSLGRRTYVESKSLARFCCEFLNLHHLAESAISEPVPPNEAQTRQLLHVCNTGIGAV